MGTIREEGEIDVLGGRIWYVKAAGDTEKGPLVVLHGGPGFTHDYLESLLDLAPERTVVLYDQLGSGRSVTAASDPALWTVERFVGELEALRESLGFAHMHLLGHSWGGALAASCSIPDDHISPRRSALFMARSVLRDIRDGVRPC